MNKHNGGQAFPVANGSEVNIGMSLRDYFAGRALSGLMANPTIEWRPEKYAKEAYECADAMIAERNKS